MSILTYSNIYGDQTNLDKIKKQTYHKHYKNNITKTTLQKQHYKNNITNITSMSSIVTFIHNNKTYDIDIRFISDTSLFNVMYRNRPDKQYNVVYSTDPNLPLVAGYIKGMETPNVNEFDIILDYWGIYETYDLIYYRETYMRENMYNPEFDDDLINTDMYHNLYKMDDETIKQMRDYHLRERPNNLLYDSVNENDLVTYTEMVEDISWYDEMVNDMSWYNFMFTLAEEAGVDIIIAGGSVYSTVGVNRYNLDYYIDIDVFFVHTDKEPGNNLPILTEADKIAMFINLVKMKYEIIYNNQTGKDAHISYTRTKYAISIHVQENKSELPNVNFVLKMHKTYSEVLHSFDVDCCCVGWDGSDIWVTERCRFSLLSRYNTFNPNLISDMYELRLAKYAVLGMPLYVNDIDRYEVEHDLNVMFEIDTTMLSGLSLISYALDVYINTYDNMMLTQLSDYELKRQLIPGYDFNKYYNIGVLELSPRAKSIPSDNDNDNLILYPYMIGSYVYDITSNNPNVGELYIIETQTIRHLGVIASLTFSEHAYDIIRQDNLILTRRPEMQITSINQPITSVFDKIAYDEDDWYVGVLVSRK